MDLRRYSRNGGCARDRFGARIALRVFDGGVGLDTFHLVSVVSRLAGTYAGDGRGRDGCCL